MRPTKRNFTSKAVFVTASIVGLLYFLFSIEVISIFGKNEPYVSWVWISGPLSALPAVIISWFNNKFGGYWLIIGGILSLVTILSDNDIGHILTPQLNWLTLPMIFMGIVFLVMPSENKG